MLKLNPDLLPPLPDNIEDCHKEIRYLQRVLFTERQYRWKEKVQHMNDHKATVGEIKALKAKLGIK